MRFSFHVMPDDSKVGGSKITSLEDLGGQWQEEMVKSFGRCKTLFGEPLTISDNYEDMFLYSIRADADSGESCYLHVYSGPSGPAIGGGGELCGEAAEELKQYILSAEPADYDYVGYYMDAPCKVEQGIRNGKPYIKEMEMSEKEIDEVFKRWGLR